jgi:ankyrin repeat protein
MIERVQQSKVTKPLFEAIKKGDVEKVKLFISEGSDVNEKDDKGMTPLHEAAYYAQKEAAKVLIAKGSEVDVLLRKVITSGHFWSAGAVGQR